ESVSKTNRQGSKVAVRLADLVSMDQKKSHAIMSAIGPKQTWHGAPHMSAFGGKADMTVCACLLLRSLLGVKQTWTGALHMSAFDPKRTLAVHCDNSF